MDFGRQGKPISVTLKGEYPDVHEWFIKFKRQAESAGDQVDAYKGEAGSDGYSREFKIFPRAVND